VQDEDEASTLCLLLAAELKVLDSVDQRSCTAPLL